MLGFLMALETDEDRRRLGTIYQDNLLYMEKMAARMFPDHPAMAEDAISATFLAVAERFEALRGMPRGMWPPYLIVALKNHCKNLLKTETRQEVLKETRSGEPPDVEGLREDYALAVRTIWAMEEKYREVLEYCLILQWSSRETAEQLNISESLVSKRLRRGRELVEEKMREEGVTHG